MESTRKIGQDRYFLKILTFWSIFVQKSTFGNWTFTQFLSFEWRNGSQNRNVLEKLSGTGPFWKFWLFGQGQGSTRSKHFLSLFFFFFCRRFGPGPVSRSVKSVSGGDVIEQRACMRVAREINSGACKHVRGSSRACHCRHSAPDLLKARGGAWLIVRACNFWVLQIGARWISWYCSFSKI